METREERVDSLPSLRSSPRQVYVSCVIISQAEKPREIDRGLRKRVKGKKRKKK